MFVEEDIILMWICIFLCVYLVAMPAVIFSCFELAHVVIALWMPLEKNLFHYCVPTVLVRYLHIDCFILFLKQDCELDMMSN